MDNGIPFLVLIVDDDQDDRYLIDEAFKKIGYEAQVKKFIDGKMLLRYLEQLEPSLYPSLIVLENKLPGLEASDLLVILKSNPLYQAIPVIVYTSAASSAAQEQLIALGAYACLEKADNMEELVLVAKELKYLAEATVRK